MRQFVFIILLTIVFSANSQNNILPGAYNLKSYLPLLSGKSVAVVANHTSFIENSHLVDTLLSLGVKVSKIFCPEHGFRGTASAGEKIKNSKDFKTGLPIVSLYGSHKKPTKKDLEGIDVVVFDIQDVGVRFYTYISTLQLVSEACAENNIPLIVLDRPNPNGFYVDGPILDTTKYRSFIGMQPVPIVYGMTIGEYILMLKGEKWLNTKKSLNLTVIKCQNYTHNSLYELPIMPSPNLKDMKAIYLYPSLCLLEGTLISVGRGTLYPFRIYGAPFFPDTLSYKFKPVSMEGAFKPKFENELCYGYDVSDYADTILQKKQIILDFIINSYKLTPEDKKEKFFKSSFNKLIGNSYVKEFIIEERTAGEIRKEWQKELNRFKKIRAKYLLYD